MQNPTPHVVIIGGAGGLGRGSVEEHLRRGWRVTATVRSPEALDDIASDRLTVELLDTTDWPRIRIFAERLPTPIDRLFVIAGTVGPDCAVGQAEPADFSQVMTVNALAPLHIIDNIYERLKPKASVVVMSSWLGSLQLNENGGFEIYRMSKAALNMGLKSLAIRRSDERTFIAINPGWVRTTLGGPNATLSVEESIPKVVDVLDRHGEEGGMAFLDFTDKMLPW